MDSIAGLIDSVHRISVPSTGAVILDYTDWLTDTVKITPNRIVQVEQLLGAAGVMTFDRGNRSHTITFQSVREFGSLREAAMDQWTRTATLPAGGVDLLIQIQGTTGNYTLKAATIMAAPSDTCHFLSLFSFTIQGGSLIGPGFSEEQRVTEDGQVRVTEDGQVRIVD